MGFKVQAVVSYLLHLSALCHTASKCYSSINVFGDSMSDTGNTYRLTNSTFPPTPYNRGRFTNYRVWSEHVANALNTTLHTYAFGYSTTNNALNMALLKPFTVPSTWDQVQVAMAARPPRLFPDALYVIWTGGQDMLSSNWSVDHEQLSERVMESVRSLVDSGARNVVLMTAPSAGASPYGFKNATAIDAVMDKYNALLQKKFREYKTQVDPTIYLVIFDVATILKAGLTTLVPSFKYIYEPCINLVALQVCKNPDDYVFWDVVHPTDRVHGLLSTFFISMAMGVRNQSQYIKECSGQVETPPSLVDNGQSAPSNEEATCNYDSTVSVGAAIGIAFGSFLLGAVIACIGFVLFKRRQQRALSSVSGAGLGSGQTKNMPIGNPIQ